MPQRLESARVGARVLSPPHNAVESVVRSNVRRARIESELTRAECAHIIDIPLDDFRDCETGLQTFTPRQLSELADVFSVPVTHFFSHHPSTSSRSGKTSGAKK